MAIDDERIPLTDTPFEIAGRTLRSRLILGTGGFKRLETLKLTGKSSRGVAISPNGQTLLVPNGRTGEPKGFVHSD